MRRHALQDSSGSHSARTSPESVRSPLGLSAGGTGAGAALRGGDSGFYRPRSSTTGSLPETPVTRRIRDEDIVSPASVTQTPLRETPRRNM